MARGKHGARAAIRRAEAAHEHIDRLTDQLAEAKLRARTYERDAARVPKLVEEVERLRALNEAGSSDAVEAERRAREGDRTLFANRMNLIAKLIGQNEFSRFRSWEYRALRAWMGAHAFKVLIEAAQGHELSRNQRRNADLPPGNLETHMDNVEWFKAPDGQKRLRLRGHYVPVNSGKRMTAEDVEAGARADVEYDEDLFTPAEWVENGEVDGDT